MQSSLLTSCYRLQRMSAVVKGCQGMGNQSQPAGVCCCHRCRQLFQKPVNSVSFFYMAADWPWHCVRVQVLHDVYSRVSKCQDNLPLALNEVYVCTVRGCWFFVPAFPGLRSKRWLSLPPTHPPERAPYGPPSSLPCLGLPAGLHSTSCSGSVVKWLWGKRAL